MAGSGGRDDGVAGSGGRDGVTGSGREYVFHSANHCHVGVFTILENSNFLRRPGQPGKNLLSFYYFLMVKMGLGCRGLGSMLTAETNKQTNKQTNKTFFLIDF